MFIRLFLRCVIVIMMIAMLLPVMRVHSTDSALFGQAPGTGSVVSEQEFKSIPDWAKPWVYWRWVKGNVTRESIIRELEALKEQGVGGILLCDTRGYYDDYYTGNIPVPLHIKMEFMSAEWREMVSYAMREADRLGLKMSINLANAGGALRGPWDMGPKGPKRLIWAAATVQGPTTISTALKPPAHVEHSWDVALLAVRVGGKSIRDVDSSPIDLANRWYEVVDDGKGDAAIAQEIIDLTDHVTDNRLNWEVPAGEWRILRFDCATFEKQEQHGGTSAGKGSVDVLNADAVETYFDLMGNQLLDDAGSLAGATLKYFYNVSWEGIYPNWTLGFAEEFLKYRGYSVKPYLPVLTGMVVENMNVSQRFILDYNHTLSDLFRNNCYRKIGDLCHARGMKWHSENGGPWRRSEPLFSQADMLEFWGINDTPQGEFWVDSYREISNARFVAMAAHIYGKPLVAMEAFTNMDYHWSKYPGYLKPFADKNYIDGANMFIWHTFTSSPKEVGKPGYEFFAGTHINLNITWWEEAGNFFHYLGRCQYLLQKGRYVADVLTYVSDKNYVESGRGEEWSAEPSLTLGPGYKYDLVNTEILINQLSVKDGRLVLPGGMEYQMLIVDLEEETVPPEVLETLYRLLENGATVILGKRCPTTAPGLKNYPESDRNVKMLSMKLWGEESGAKERRPIGKGTLISGESPDKVLRDSGILPDFEGPFEYIHRTAEGLDIYLVSGTGQAECFFRVSGLIPELWDPVTGRVMEAVNYHVSKDGRTIIPLDLPENGSTFVVFRRPGEHQHFTEIDGPAKGLEIVSQSESAVNVYIWKTGVYRLKTSREKAIELQAEAASPVDLSDLWQVKFAEGWGAPAETVFENLILWNTHADPGIKYFSGKAVYQKTFQLSLYQTGQPARLQLGEVYNLAHVRLNGQDMGTVWTNPWTVDVTDILKSGSNSLEIEVTNCWANRLIGDAGLPPDERFTSTNLRLISERGNYRNFEAYAADDPLMPSGLVGPVRIEFGEQRFIRF